MHTKLTRITYDPTGPAIKATAWAIVCAVIVLCILAAAFIAYLSISEIALNHKSPFIAVLFPLFIGISVFRAVRNFLRPEQRALFTSGGMIFPIGNLIHLRGRRWRTWEELTSATLVLEPEAHLIMRFQDGSRVCFQLAAMPPPEVEQLLVTVETWGTRKLAGPFSDYRSWLADSLSGDGTKTYTALWNDELTRRFQLCTFLPLAPGAKLQEGRYVIIGQLGFGGFAAVYNGLDSRGLQVAIKELCLDSVQNEEAKLQVAAHIDSEVAVLAKLQHPKICKLLDSFVEAGRNYIVIERIPGKNLRQLVAEQGPLSEMQAVEMIFQMVEILTYLHSLTPPVVHRDFTPENLIWTESSTLVLVDFNAASELVSGLTGTVVGKTCYMPPEQVRGKAVPASDYYAMGCTIFFMLTGRDPKPFTAINLDHCEAKASEPMKQLVWSLTQPEVAARPGHPSILGELVQSLAPGLLTKHGKKRGE